MATNVGATTPTNSTATPQGELSNALNFSSGGNNATLGDNIDEKSQKFKAMLSNFIKTSNDSKLIYPGVAIIVASLLVILILFQKISAGIKVLAIIILLLFLAITVYQFKKQ